MASHVNTLYDEVELGTFRGWYSNTETLSGQKDLVDADLPLQYLDPGGAARDVILPVETGSNHSFVIVNTADAAETITVKTVGDVTIGTVAQGETKVFVSNGINTGGLNGWAMVNGGSSTTGSGAKYPCDGRLTLESGVAISTSDQVDKTTLYFTPYKGDQIGLYDGVSAWDTLSFSELSLNISAFTASKPYDIWVYNNAGVAALDSTVWTNATTRATALALQDGVLVKSGATTRRYIGTIYMDAASKCQDMAYQRFVWNYYNRSNKLMSGSFLSTNHTYTTSAWRGWNNDTTVGSARCAFVCGITDDSVAITSWFRLSSTGSGQYGQIGTAINGLDAILGVAFTFGGSGFTFDTFTPIHLTPANGYNYLNVVEYGVANSAGYTYATLSAALNM
jgi:hypothetical protein